MYWDGIRILCGGNTFGPFFSSFNGINWVNSVPIQFIPGNLSGGIFGIVSNTDKFGYIYKKIKLTTPLKLYYKDKLHISSLKAYNKYIGETLIKFSS
jgi:hypothetical protein